MEQITRDMVINEVLKRYPATIAVFNAFRVDACCGGGRSIEATAEADGMAVQALLDALNKTLAAPSRR